MRTFRVVLRLDLDHDREAQEAWAAALYTAEKLTDIKPTVARVGNLLVAQLEVPDTAVPDLRVAIAPLLGSSMNWPDGEHRIRVEDVTPRG